MIHASRGSQVEGRAEINLSADYDFDVMDIGSNTWGRIIALLVAKGYKYINLVNTMPTRLRGTSKRYGSTPRVKRAFRDKLNKVIQSREIWPIYTDMEEYKKLRDTKYN